MRIRSLVASILFAALPLADCTRAFAEEGRPSPVRAPSGMVVTSSVLASEIGRDVLVRGGNAVDAAIAVGFALAVVHPSAGNIGGGGFMIVRQPDGEALAFDFRERAPGAAHPEMFLDEAGDYSERTHHYSALAVGVPGTVAGLEAAHERFGTQPWSELVEPAVGLAADGFPLTPAQADSFHKVVEAFADYPATVATFSREGTPYEVGDRWIQTDLAATLERIRQHGRVGFYSGRTAELLVAEMDRLGGLIDVADLAAYKAVERQPVRGSYRDHQVTSMPLPSSGGTILVEMLNILEAYDLRSLGHQTAPYVHHLAEAMRLAYRDRALYLADADIVDVPVERLTDKAWAARRRQELQPARAGVSTPADIEIGQESAETTHFSVVDGAGMAVAVTYTLEAGFGSGIVVPGAGFLLNNEMGDFNGKPGLTTEEGLVGTEPNLARPGQRMLSSMTPTIVERDGELLMVLGTPGGRTIINSVLQVVLNVVDFGMDLDEAVTASRFHHQWLPDRIRVEEDGLDPSVVEALEGMGHQVDARGTQGRVNAILIDPATGERLGFADPRAPDGAAAGH